MKTTIILLSLLVFGISFTDVTKQQKSCKDTVEVLKQTIAIKEQTNRIQKELIRKRDSIIFVQDSIIVSLKNKTWK